MLRFKCLQIAVMMMLITSCNKDTMSRASGCGVLFTYSEDFVDKVRSQRAQIRKLPNMREASIIFDDYSTTRESIRICAESRESTIEE